jgi:hypothetical protein
MLLCSGLLACDLAVLGCSDDRAAHLPGKTIGATLDNAIKVLEAGDCAAFAVDFLNPIKLGQIEDVEAYRQTMVCTPANQANIDEVLLALKLARLAEPKMDGVVATINLGDVGLGLSHFTLMRYTDGKWYFNSL